MDSGSGIMPLSSPGGSTLQWGAGRCSLCPASFVGSGYFAAETISCACALFPMSLTPS